MAASVTEEQTGDPSLEALELRLLVSAIASRYGYDLRHYAPPVLAQRVREAMRCERVATISALQERVLHDAGGLERFLLCLASQRTSMFPDPALYAALREQVVPWLRTCPSVRIWCAGCGGGEEVYSLAIVLEEEGIYDRCRIYATDISETLLARARRGVYPRRRLAAYASNYARAGGAGELSDHYAATADGAAIRDSLRRNLVFAHHNLVCDAPFNEFNLVLCRSLLRSYDAELRERALGVLYSSLCRFGVLAIGRGETLRYSRYELCFEPLGPAELSLYRRRN